MSILPIRTTSFADRVALEDSMALELVSGNDAKGNPSYALLLLPANQVASLRKALEVRNVTLEDYGTVLAKGEGLTPPDGLIDDIRGLLTRK